MTKSNNLNFKTGDIVEVNCSKSISTSTGVKYSLKEGDIVRIETIFKDIIGTYLYNFRTNKTVYIDGIPVIKRVFTENELPFLLFKEL